MSMITLATKCQITYRLFDYIAHYHTFTQLFLLFFVVKCNTLGGIRFLINNTSISSAFVISIMPLPMPARYIP